MKSVGLVSVYFMDVYGVPTMCQALREPTPCGPHVTLYATPTGNNSYHLSDLSAAG